VSSNEGMQCKLRRGERRKGGEEQNNTESIFQRRSRWRRALWRESAAAHMLILRVRIPPEAWLSVSCECCVSSGRNLCEEPITCPEQYCRLCCV
jgi:hypothetical protein